MPKIIVNKKTKHINIEGDCGSEWEGECDVVDTKGDKIRLDCKTELIEECEDMEIERLIDEVAYGGEACGSSEQVALKVVENLRMMGIAASYRHRGSCWTVYTDPESACPSGQEETDGFCAERLENPELFEPDSFRMICPKCTNMECDRCHELNIELEDTPHIIIGCPKGDWDPKKQICLTSTRRQAILRPKSHMERYGPKITA